MATQTLSAATSCLRIASQRLSAAQDVRSLPVIAAGVAQVLTNCHSLFVHSSSKSKKDSEAGLALHRWNTQLNTLLQARTVQERWAAVVLIKATIEAGGWDILSKSEPWVRGLLNILKRSDPPTTKRLCMTTLTRIFQLTWDHPTLVREITTPALAPFISTCLGLVSGPRSQPSDLDFTAVFDSFATLLPRHPTVFRTQQSQIEGLLRSIVDSTTSPRKKQSAARLLALLPQCEPRQGSGDKWLKDLKSSVARCHTALDTIFAHVQEEWRSTAGHNTSLAAANNAPHGSNGSLNGADKKSTKASAQTALDSLSLVAHQISNATSSPVSIPLGLLVDLMARICAIAAKPDGSGGSARYTQDTTKEEREAVANALPRLHTVTMELMGSLVALLGSLTLPCLDTLLDQIIWVFQVESADATVRTGVYSTLQTLLNQAGPSMQKEAIEQVAPIIKGCCNDVLPAEGDHMGQNSQGSASASNAIANADVFLTQPETSKPRALSLPALQQAASDLLPVLLAKLSAEQMPPRLRAQLDRTAVLCGHKEALIASVLNPPSKQAKGSQSSSLLPLLARQYASDPNVEALLRPRMPVIKTNAIDGDDEPSDEEDNEMDYAAEALTLPSNGDHDPVGVANGGQDSVLNATEGASGLQPTTALGVNDLKPSNGEAFPIAAALPSAKRETTATKRAYEGLPQQDAKRSRVDDTQLPASTDGTTDDVDTEMGRPESRDDVVETSARTAAPIVAREQSTTLAPATLQAAGPDGDSDDDDFVIPTLDLGSSSDDEEEEE